MQRNSNLNKILINRFVIFVFCFIILTYYVFVFQFMFSLMDKYPGTSDFLLVIFHFSFIMMFWSLLTAMFTEPGKVPLYWGFFLDESDQKKKRFCLICHIFKPERCHHCSACNKCVLNMDHHCPWINNCIGFYNRKFFILMLFYVITTLFIANLGMTIGIFEIFDDIENFQSIYVLRIIMYMITLPLFVVISMFFKFHIKLILSNTTTIENLDKKRSTNSNTLPPNSPNFDLGPYYNWVQVFGIKPMLWFFPIFFGQYGKPAGDGIIWPQLPTRESVKNHDVRDLENSTINMEVTNLKYSKKMDFRENAKENNPNLVNSMNGNYALGSIPN